MEKSHVAVFSLSFILNQFTRFQCGVKQVVDEQLKKNYVSFNNKQANSLWKSERSERKNKMKEKETICLFRICFMSFRQAATEEHIESILSKASED